MKPEQLNRALRLVKRAGEKFLIMDTDTDKVFALMDLGDYERILEMKHEPIEDYSEEEMLDKIDRDLQYWRSRRLDDEDEDFDLPSAKPIVDELEPDDDGWIDEINDIIETPQSEAEFLPEPEIKSAPIAHIENDFTPINQGLEEKIGNVQAEESLSDLPEDEAVDSDDDEKFYLEPVE